MDVLVAAQDSGEMSAVETLEAQAEQMVLVALGLLSVQPLLHTDSIASALATDPSLLEISETENLGSVFQVLKADLQVATLAIQLASLLSSAPPSFTTTASLAFRALAQSVVLRASMALPQIMSPGTPTPAPDKIPPGPYEFMAPPPTTSMAKPLSLQSGAHAGRRLSQQDYTGVISLALLDLTDPGTIVDLMNTITGFLSSSTPPPAYYNSSPPSGNPNLAAHPILNLGVVVDATILSILSTGIANTQEVGQTVTNIGTCVPALCIHEAPHIL